MLISSELADVNAVANALIFAATLVPKAYSNDFPVLIADCYKLFNTLVICVILFASIILL